MLLHSLDELSIFRVGHYFAPNIFDCALVHLQPVWLELERLVSFGAAVQIQNRQYNSLGVVTVQSVLFAELLEALVTVCNVLFKRLSVPALLLAVLDV